MIRTSLAALFAVVVSSAAFAQQPGDTQLQQSASASDEAAIRAAIASYVEAYNRADAAATAAHWGENAEWTDPAGEIFLGRAAIEAAMKDAFAESQGTKIEVLDPKVRFPAPGVAIEEGKVRVTSPSAPPTESTYIAVHVKQADGWKLNTVRETETRSAADVPEELAELAWMVGDWTDASDEETAETSVKWSKNNKYLIGDFRISVPGMDDLEGVQFIGWDPGSEVIRSWMFDFDGGYGEGVWTRAEAPDSQGQWTVDFAQVLPDGRKATSTNVYTLIDADHYGWQSVDRQVDGEPLDDVAETTVVRKKSTSTEAVAEAKAE
jgi:uncharacterized protein (TIGR02246 family)